MSGSQSITTTLKSLSLSLSPSQTIMGKNFYAVKGGLDGPRVYYDDWTTCLRAIHRQKGVKYKGFQTKGECARFLGVVERELIFVAKGGGRSKVPSTVNNTIDTANPSILSTHVQCKDEERRGEKRGGEREKEYVPNLIPLTERFSYHKERSSGSVSSSPSLSSSKRTCLSPSPSPSSSSLKKVKVTPSFSPSSDSHHPSSSLPILSPSEKALISLERERRQIFSETCDIYTDGGCTMNGSSDAKAGIGVFYGNGDVRNISMRLPGSKQSNNRAELLAALLGVLGTDPKQKRTIYTDSQYTIKAVTKWFPSWEKEISRERERNGFEKSQNWDLIHLLYTALKDRPLVKLVYVPAHTGVPGNEGADQLATAAIKTWY